jgi:regulator of cell morphogenesis and NO signaling
MPSDIDTDQTLAALVEQNPERARLFESRNLDFCCGGDQTLSEACEDHDLDLEEICEEITELDNRNPASDDEQFDSITEIADYIVDHHHEYLRDELAPLSELIDKVEGVHGDNHPELHEVADVFEQLAREIPVHLSEEEQILFPIVRQLDEADASGVEAETASQLLEGLEDDHDETAEHLEEIRELTDGFAVPDDACPSYQNMLERLEELERDLHMHVHRENNVLFEKVRERVEG